MTTLPKFYTIEDLRRFADYEGSPWFSPQSMKFFKTRLTSEFKQITDKKYLFVTTEKGPDEIRRASIRVATLAKTKSGHWKVSIGTHGEFNNMTLVQAKSLFKKV